VLAEFAAKKKEKLNPDPFLLRASHQSFYNISPIGYTTRPAAAISMTP
jgi:type I restriction enzyme M protein